MMPGVDQLLLHTGLPGRVGTPTSRVIRAHRRQLKSRGIEIGRLSRDPKGADRILVPEWHVPSGSTSIGGLFLSSPRLLGLNRIGHADAEKFRPDAESLVGHIIEAVQPRCTTIVIETLPPASVLQLAYERELRLGTIIPPGEFFEPTRPLVDLRDLKDRLAAIDTVGEVDLIALRPGDRPDPNRILESLRPKRHYLESATPMKRLLDRFVDRGAPRSKPSYATLTGVDLPSAKPLMKAIDGLQWTPRAVAASLSVNQVQGIEASIRSDLHDFVLATISDDPDPELGIWSREQSQEIEVAHHEAALGLFILS